MVPKRALANARLGVNFVPDMTPEPKLLAKNDSELPNVQLNLKPPEFAVSLGIGNCGADCGDHVRRSAT